MGNIKINSVLTNDLGEKTAVDVVGEHDSDNNIIYYENNILVTLVISQESVRVKREHPDYELTLYFEQGRITQTEYILRSLNSVMTIEIFTDILEIEEGKIRIIYSLSLNNQSMGKFEYIISFVGC
jgi:uncharacterized beta-barrel protein YwiB (DUF1934 family)